MLVVKLRDMLQQIMRMKIDDSNVDLFTNESASRVIDAVDRLIEDFDRPASAP